MQKGVYTAVKKDGTLYYRSSFTYKNKHISLGSYSLEADANKAYLEAIALCSTPELLISSYNKKKYHLSLDKWVSIINFRDNNIYFKNPIYIKPNYFIYYLDADIELKFDVDDLFYYSTHKIMKRGGHLFVADYGMQVTITSRYGIKSFAVPGKDYIFVNGDNTDYRHSNIKIINRYAGVNKIDNNGRDLYISKMHINGDIIIGRYDNETDAAIAYNKAANILISKGFTRAFQTNYIEDMSSIEYAKRYNKIRVSKSISELE